MAEETAIVLPNPDGGDTARPPVPEADGAQSAPHVSLHPHTEIPLLPPPEDVKIKVDDESDLFQDVAPSGTYEGRRAQAFIITGVGVGLLASVVIVAGAYFGTIAYVALFGCSNQISAFTSIWRSNRNQMMVALSLDICLVFGSCLHLAVIAVRYSTLLGYSESELCQAELQKPCAAGQFNELTSNLKASLALDVTLESLTFLTLLAVILCGFRFRAHLSKK